MGLVQLGNGRLAYHASIRHYTDATDSEPVLQAINNGNQGLYIRRVAGPQFTADRPASIVHHHADDHLPAIRPMVLAVPISPKTFTALPFKVNACRIEKHQVQ